MISFLPHYTTMSMRSWSTNALVLSLSPFGEGHREALLLTEDRGLVRAAVFGGAKSKLRALVSPWHSGTVWVYSDPVKKTNKITDFDVTAYRQGLRESLLRSWCASVCTETVTRSHGVADWRLVNAFLDGISVSCDTECHFALLRFLWRTILAAGLNPDSSVCAHCGKNLENTIVFYLPHEDAFLCVDCAQSENSQLSGTTSHDNGRYRNDDRRFPLSPRALEYLSAIECLTPAQARNIRPNESEYAELRQFLFFLVSRMIDGPLKTLETGEGIL